MGRFFYHRHLLKLLVLINFLGTIWGFWWYHLQLAVTPVWWWPFVPDSPLSTCLFTLTIGLFLLNKKIPGLHLLACLFCIKYGLWAVAIITNFWAHGGTVQPLEIMLCFSHLGMVAEGIIYLFLIPPNNLSWMPFTIYTWTNDFVDYFFDKHPYFFYKGQENFGFMGVIILSSILTTLVLIYSFITKKSNNGTAVRE